MPGDASSTNGGDPRAIDAWTDYWRTGRDASCLDGSAVEVRLTRIWGEFVDGLPDGARLLDLATGNGVVARTCAAHAREHGRRLRIDAVDAAAIDPPPLDDTRFHAAVRLEALPFQDASFDAVVSQFGFEYADEARAVAEAARVLAPAGRLRLVVHAHDGAVAHDIGARLDRLRSALAEEGPIAIVLALARAWENDDRATVERLTALLPEALALTRDFARRPPQDDAALFYSAEFLQLWNQRARYHPADLRRSIEEGWHNASGVALRQQDMLRAARTAEGAAALAGRLSAAGLETGPAGEIRDEQRDARIAWLIDARRRPPAG